MRASPTLTDALAPLRANPARAAVLLDVDGTLAPIVRHAQDAQVPEATRAVLIEVSRRYAVVAVVSGRRASDARRIVSIGSIAYLGSHGSEVLPPGGVRPRLDRELASWQRRITAFLADSDSTALARLRVRLEDKGPIAAYHWRGAPDEERAQTAVSEIADRAEAAGFVTHWGRKVLEVRPPVRIDKGAGVMSLLRDAAVDTALYAGDDVTDLDAFRALGELQADGRLHAAVRVGVVSDEGPQTIGEESDVTVEGPPGVRGLLEALLEPG